MIAPLFENHSDQIQLKLFISLRTNLEKTPKKKWIEKLISKHMFKLYLPCVRLLTPLLRIHNTIN